MGAWARAPVVGCSCRTRDVNLPGKPSKPLSQSGASRDHGTWVLLHTWHIVGACVMSEQKGRLREGQGPPTATELKKEQKSSFHIKTFPRPFWDDPPEVRKCLTPNLNSGCN